MKHCWEKYKWIGKEMKKTLQRKIQMDVMRNTKALVREIQKHCREKYKGYGGKTKNIAKKNSN